MVKPLQNIIAEAFCKNQRISFYDFFYNLSNYGQIFIMLVSIEQDDYHYYYYFFDQLKMN